MKPCAADDATRSSASGGVEVRRRVERGLVEAGLEPRRERRRGFQCAVPASRRSETLASPSHARPSRSSTSSASPSELVGRDRPQLRGDLRRGEVHGGCADAREPRRVVARGDAPGARRRVDVGQDLDVLGPDAERVGDDLGGDGAVTLALRRRPDPDGDPAERRDDHGRALRRCPTSAAPARAPPRSARA